MFTAFTALLELFVVTADCAPAVYRDVASCVTHGATGSRCCLQGSAVQYSTVQYSTVQYSTVQYSTVQYSTVQYYSDGKGQCGGTINLNKAEPCLNISLHRLQYSTVKY